MDAIQAWWSSEEGVLFTDPVYGHRIGLCYQGGSTKKYCLVLNGVRLEDMTLFLAKLGHAKHDWAEESELKYVVAFPILLTSLSNYYQVYIMATTLQRLSRDGCVPPQLENAGNPFGVQKLRGRDPQQRNVR